jgi:integrase
VQGVRARFHIIRHSVASAMLAEGKVSVRTASEILGHASTSITADTYAHVAQDAKRAALGLVSDALGR